MFLVVKKVGAIFAFKLVVLVKLEGWRSDVGA